MMKLRIEAPWYTYQKKIKALFERDPEIMVCEVVESEKEDEDYCFSIEVKNHEKFIALDRLLPTIRVFGNVVLRIYLYDLENEAINNPTVNLYETLFKGNKIVKDIRTLTDVHGFGHSFVRFEPEVVQFFDDDISDYSGNWSGLAQDIAKEVFEGTNWEIGFCTADLNENEEDTAKPLGEWP